MSKIIKEPTIGIESRNKIKVGIDKAANAVKPTLGAIGMSALIDLGGDFFPIEADDGITVLRNLSFEDRYEQMGLLMLKKRVQTVSDEGGDATATTTTLTQAVCQEAINEWNTKEENTRKVVERLEQGLKDVKEQIKVQAVPVKEEDIERIATISSLDPEIGKIIADAYAKIGKDGIITVENSPTLGYSSEIVNGARFNQGYISYYFITDQDKQESVLENPAILVVNRRIASNSQLKIIDAMIKEGHTNILIIADNVESEALASLVLNHQRGVIRVCAVKPNYTGSQKDEWMEDIATLTGGKVVSEEKGIIMENVDMSYVGFAEKVIVGRSKTTIVNGQGKKEAIEERVGAIKTLIENHPVDADRLILTTYKERLATLSGGIGIIRVGAVTDTDLKAKKYKIENAINVVKGGLEEGIIIGGGACLARISNKIKEPIFKKALKAPITVMAKNAGMYDKKPLWKICGKPTVNNVIKSLDGTNPVYGYNFITKEFCDMFKSGIIDSAKNTRLAVEAATSTALSLVRGETIITEVTKE